MCVRLPAPDILAATAAESSSLVDMMRRLELPLTSRQRRYLGDRLGHYGIATPHFQAEPLPPRPRRAYARETLEAAAGESADFTEFLERLGVPVGEPYFYLRKRLSHFGIDTSHWTAEGRRGSPTGDAQELASAVAEAQSMAGVLRALGQPVNTSTRRRISNRIQSLGLSTSHFTGQAHQKGRPSSNRKTAEQILCRRPPGSLRTPARLLRRALHECGVPAVCAECGQGDTWRGRRIVLEIDHRNGDRLDDRPTNLRYLCPNCHSQTATYCRTGP
ncbi:hypothetical protein SRB5_40840 [Streptomyces sp. RB5]|uniref:HNH endonuclease n=1 Tax=Streptomyces smaragdinus TaxID=2585196 RepID=A0A7K0CKD1_9ACTN|nr:HNH endonuclease signature motif containing protein [Streptomyces smaragdinus]MQY13926.1 hypothetical protein [Streptomyces smaragdinus]